MHNTSGEGAQQDLVLVSKEYSLLLMFSAVLKIVQWYTCFSNAHVLAGNFGE